jgi:uncharacterized lipoprotein YehR (DUF1307 family)
MITITAISTRLERFILVVVFSVVGCSETKTLDLKCLGSTHLKGTHADVSDDTAYLQLNIANNMIRLEENKLVSLEPLKACTSSENKKTTDNQIYFDTAGCNTKSADKKVDRKYGTYTFSNGRLVFSEDYSEEEVNIGLVHLDAEFTCGKLFYESDKKK